MKGDSDADGVKVPSPLPRKRAGALPPTARSEMQSPLKSPTAIGLKMGPAIAGPVAAVKVPSPFPSKIVIVFPAAFATARSNFPLPLKSPAAIAEGLLPVARLAAALKVPSPLPKRIVTVLSLALVTAKSGLPSPLKSPTANDEGLLSFAELAAAIKVPFPLSQQDGHCVAISIGDREVEIAIAIEVTRCDRSRGVPGGGTGSGGVEGPISVAQQDFHRPWLGRRESVVAVGNGQVQLAIAVEVSHRKKLNV